MLCSKCISYTWYSSSFIHNREKFCFSQQRSGSYFHILSICKCSDAISAITKIKGLIDLLKKNTSHYFHCPYCHFFRAKVWIYHVNENANNGVCANSNSFIMHKDTGDFSWSAAGMTHKTQEDRNGSNGYFFWWREFNIEINTWCKVNNAQIYKCLAI